jgi:hypothetical protein
MTSSWRQTTASVLGLGAIVVGVIGISRQSVTADRAKADYRGHLVLVWAIDKAHGSVAGFARETMKSGQVTELVPVKGHVVRFEVGPIESVEVTDLRKEWKEDRLPIKIARGRASSSGSYALTDPFVSMDYGINEPIGSVSVGVPVASVDAAGYRAILGRDDVGTAAGLEDVLFAALDPARSSGPVRISDVLEIYQMLGRSERLARWTRRLSGRTPNERLEAAAVLTMLGDKAGTTAFCRACLDARGNEQVGLIDVLCQMPASDEALATIVKLIIAPGKYLLQAPKGGVSDTERRFALFRALAQKYPKESVREYAKELRTYADSLPAGSAERESVGNLLEPH